MNRNAASVRLSRGRSLFAIIMTVAMLFGAATACAEQARLSFESAGGGDSRGRYVSRDGDCLLMFGPAEIVLARLSANSALRLTFSAASPESRLQAGEDLPVRWSSQISSRGLYPGVDAVYSGSAGRLEAEFQVSPGADPSRIAFDLQGAGSIVTDSQGNLVIDSGVGQVVLLRPEATQLTDSGLQKIAAEYSVKDNHAGIELGQYDPGAPLVIRQVVSYAAAAAPFPGGVHSVANAVRTNPGFRSNVIPANDDGSGPLTPIGFTLSFFGQSYTQLYVNNNGNFTFDDALPTFTPFPLTSTARVIIAPFFADVDTRGEGSQLVTFGQDTIDGRRAFGANYVNVGYFASHTDKLNSFQVILIDRSDVGPGDFDIEFNYNTVRWETGDASGGVNGFGGVPARVGYSNGTGNPGTFFELPGSAERGAFLDSNLLTGLTVNSLNSEVQGRYLYTVRRGTVETVDLSIGSADFPDPVRAGDELTYILTVRNDGQVATSGARVRNVLPPGVIFVSATTSNGTCRGGSTLVCTLGSIPPGGSVTIRVTVIPTGQGLLTSGATVVSFQPDSNIANNTIQQTTTRVNCVGPAVRFISPSRVTAGSGDIEMLITGICFEPDTVVRFNGAPRTTTVLDSSLLKVAIPASDLATPRNVQIVVVSGNKSSAAQQFVVTSGPVSAINASGVVNAASFRAAATAAANSMLSIFGNNLSSQTATASSLPLPTTLGGVTVRVNSYVAPLLYVSPRQINFLMPWEVLGLSEVAIAVTSDLTTNAQLLTLVNADPGIFTLNEQGQGAVLTQTGEVAAAAGSIAGRASRPARRGEFISIFASGLGPVTLQPPSGAAAPQNPLARTIIVPTVTIDGVEVPVDFAGLAPGFTGLYQVNVQIPPNMRTGSAIPVVITAGDVASNTVSIAVQ